MTEHWTLEAARTALCDLLFGRRLRAAAEAELARAARLEARGAPVDVVTDQLKLAAHWEWIAVITEQGQVGWGGRHNRCGYQPAEEPLEVFADQSFDKSSPE